MPWQLGDDIATKNSANLLIYSAQIFCNKEELLECSSEEDNLFCEQDLKQSFQSAKEGNWIEEEMRSLNSVKKGNVSN